MVRRSEQLLTGVGTKLGTVVKRVFSLSRMRVSAAIVLAWLPAGSAPALVSSSPFAAIPKSKLVGEYLA